MSACVAYFGRFRIPPVKDKSLAARETDRTTRLFDFFGVISLPTQKSTPTDAPAFLIRSKTSGKNRLIITGRGFQA